MSILACRNSGILRLLAHFETISAAHAPGFLVTFVRFSATSQVNGPAAGQYVGSAAGAFFSAPSSAVSRTGHWIADLMGSRRPEIYSPQCNRRALGPLPDCNCRTLGSLSECNCRPHGSSREGGGYCRL